MADNPLILVLNTRDTWVKMPFKALGQLTPTIGLLPELSDFKNLKNLITSKNSYSSSWQEQNVAFPKRTYGRLAPLFSFWSEMTIAKTVCPNPDAIVITYPEQREIVSRFSGIPKVYYVSDDYSEDYGYSKDAVHSWEQKILSEVDHVFVVSRHLANKLSATYGTPQDSISISPNGTPESIIPRIAPLGPSPLPLPIPPHFRPLAGVLGHVSSRLRLDWISYAVEELPWLYWVFIGDVKKVSQSDLKYLSYLYEHPRCCFTGFQPYYEIFKFAAAFDVAVIPLNQEGINPCSSPVRFFSQLPFGQPILAAPGCPQIEEFSPLVTVVSNPLDMVNELSKLNQNNFNDGLNSYRWRKAQENTWERRAQMMLDIFKKII